MLCIITHTHIREQRQRRTYLTRTIIIIIILIIIIIFFGQPRRFPTKCDVTAARPCHEQIYLGAFDQTHTIVTRSKVSAVSRRRRLLCAVRTGVSVKVVHNNNNKNNNTRVIYIRYCCTERSVERTEGYKDYFLRQFFYSGDFYKTCTIFFFYLIHIKDNKKK